MRAAGLLIFFLCSASLLQAQQAWTFTGPAQGTSFKLSYYADTPWVQQSDIIRLLDQIDASMSLYDPESLISRFNASPRGGKMDLHFKRVMQKAFEIHQDTRGKVDVTILPLMKLWGFFGKRPEHKPEQEAIERTLSYIGMDLLEIRGDSLIKLHPEVQIDLNGIAQGYTVDVLADLLDDAGIRDYLVEVGGEIRVSGKKPDGQAFVLGVEGPDAQGQAQIKHTLSIEYGAITTSGSYRQFIQLDEKQYMHIMDPKTGRPVQGSILSVTLYAPDALTADGYDNALMGMEVQEALRFIDAHKALEAYLVYRDKQGKISDAMSRGFKNLLEKK